MLEISNVSLSYDIYNFKNSKIPISYSMGYSLSSDYPGFTLRELLKEADDCMYTNKKAYYAKKLL